MSLPNVNNLVDLINKTRLTEYDKLVKDTYLTSLDIIGNDIQYTYGNKQTKTFTLPVFKGATSDTNGTAGLVPAPTEDSQNKYLRGDGTWAIVSGSEEIMVSETEPTSEDIKMWVNLTGDSGVTVPEVKDDEISEQDTWSSTKINGMISNLRQITQTVLNTLPTVPTGEGDYFVQRDSSDTSFPYQYGILSIRYGSYTGEYVATFRTTGNNNKIYYNTYLTNHWSGWQEISATPIKSTQISGTTNDTGNVQLWATTDKRIPIAALIKDRYGFIFPSSNGNYYVGIFHPDNHTMPASEAVTGTIYYIEPAEVKLS